MVTPNKTLSEIIRQPTEDGRVQKLKRNLLHNIENKITTSTQIFQKKL